MRPLLPLAAAMLVAAAFPASAAPRGAAPAPAVLLVADVGEGAQRTMPAALWRKLVTDYVGAHTVAAEDGTALPDDTHCRSAHAAWAVFATFDRAMRLPGMQQDIDRAYAIARFTVRDCSTGAVLPTKTVRIESDPLAEADRSGDGSNAERTWERAVRRTLARDPLVLAARPAAQAPPAAPTAGTAPVVATPVTAAPVMTAAPVVAAPVMTAAPVVTAAPVATAAPVVTATPVAAPRGARITRIVDRVVYLQAGSGFFVNQVLRAVAAPDAKPHPPVELVVLEINREYVAASIVGNGSPQVGDYVETAPADK